MTSEEAVVYHEYLKDRFQPVAEREAEAVRLLETALRGFNDAGDYQRWFNEVNTFLQSAKAPTP